MFSRVSNAAHICLRCQLRLHRPVRPLSNPPFLPAISNPRRYQSAAAVQVDDEDVRSTPDGSRSIGAPKGKEGPSKKKRRNKLSKRWRPSPTAELGMNALGKPSEVLLLSPRDRKIPVVPKDSNEESKESFYESVAYEKQPHTWEQVKENIGQAREQIQQRRGTLTPEAWSNLKKVMSKGFTQNQLRRYLEETSSDPERGTKRRTKVVGKEPIIRLIAKHIWNYELPAQPLNPSQHAEKPGLEKTLSLPPCSKEQQLVIERNPVANLRNAATQRGVKIFFDKQRTTISGPIERATEIRTALQKQISSIKKMHRAISNHTELLQDGAEKEDVQILVEMLAQKYGVHATVTSSGDWQLKVLCTPNNQTSADRLHHEYRLLLERGADRLPFTTVLPDNQRVFVTHYAPDLLNTYPYPKHLRRAQLIKASDADMSSSSISKLVQKKLILKQNPAKKSGQPCSEYAAELGLVLFDHSITSGKSGFTGMRSIFAPEVPFLRSLLASHDLQKPISTKPSTSTARLCFTPLDHRKSGQVIEVELLGVGHHGVLTKDIRIHRISMVKAGNSLNLLRPMLPVDIKLSHRHRVDLYHSTSPQSSAIHTAISNYMDARLKSVEDQELAPNQVPAPKFPLFLDLPLPTPFATQSSAEKAPSAAGERDIAKKIKSHTYFLSDFSILATDLYEFEHKSNRYKLEHINYIAQNPNADSRTHGPSKVMPGPFRDRQALIIKHDSPRDSQNIAQAAEPGKQKVFKAIRESKQEKVAKADFEKFLGAALWVAKRIGQEGNKVKQEIEMIK